MADTSTWEKELFLTTAEAVALVKRSERERANWALHVRFSAYDPKQPDKHYPDGCGHYLNLSRADALWLVEKSLSPSLEAKGGRMKIRRHETTSTITGNRVTYWIGG